MPFNRSDFHSPDIITTRILLIGHGWSVFKRCPSPSVQPAGFPASIAGLPVGSAMVCVGPPLLARGPSTALMLIRHYELYRLYVLKPMHREAAQELARSVTLSGFEEIALRIRQSFARFRFESAMQEWANEIEHLNASKQAFLPTSAADVYAILGDKDHAFYWLEQAYQHPELASIDDGLIDLKTDPLLDSLRSDPRYKGLLRRIGLPQQITDVASKS